MIGFFFCSKTFIHPTDILYLNKSQIRPGMEYYYVLWTEASQYRAVFVILMSQIDVKPINCVQFCDNPPTMLIAMAVVCF